MAEATDVRSRSELNKHNHSYRHAFFPSWLKLLRQGFRTDKKKSILIDMIARQRGGAPGWFWSVLSLNDKNRIDTQGWPESQTHRPEK